MIRICLLTASVIILFPWAMIRAGEPLASPDPFKARVLPILAQNCLDCHQSDSPNILWRGDLRNPGPLVSAGGPQVLADASDSASEEHRTGRLGLATWMTSHENPLTWRVMANRLWHYHFGRGLVATPSNFGRLGEPPSHPDLLDWLAAELIRTGAA